MYYMTILKGERADRAKPIVAISDQGLIRYVLRELGRMAGPERAIMSVADHSANGIEIAGRRVSDGPQDNDR